MTESTPQAPDTSEVLRELGGLSLAELKEVSAGFGQRVHAYLSAMDNPPELFFRNGVGLGADVAALADNDGSSRYLVGGDVSYAAPFDPADELSAMEAIKNAPDFLTGDSYFLGSDGFSTGDDAGVMSAYGGHFGPDDSLHPSPYFYSYDYFRVEGLPADPLERRKAVQLVSGMATLDTFLRMRGAEEQRGNLREFLVEGVPEVDLLSKTAEKVESSNYEAWKVLMPALVDYLDGSKMVIGESFTCGLLAQVLTSLPGASQIFNQALTWYDPRLKAYVGVPDENLTAARIADPDTIELATQGLLDMSSEDTQLALGTTGWANHGEPGTADNFSVGMALREGEGLTAQVEVIHTQAKPRSKGRRQLTRHLGVTTALYLIAKQLSSQGADCGFMETQLRALLDLSSEVTLNAKVAS